MPENKCTDKHKPQLVHTLESQTQATCASNRILKNDCEKYVDLRTLNFHLVDDMREVKKTTKSEVASVKVEYNLK